MSSEEDRLALALGRALIQTWAELPQGIRHTIFERAVAADQGVGDSNSFRSKLGVFLHDRNPRTA